MSVCKNKGEFGEIGRNCENGQGNGKRRLSKEDGSSAKGGVFGQF